MSGLPRHTAFELHTVSSAELLLVQEITGEVGQLEATVSTVTKELATEQQQQPKPQGMSLSVDSVSDLES